MAKNEELKRMDAARNFPSETCPASRHAAMIAEALIEGGVYPMIDEEPTHVGETLASVVASLWEARAELSNLKGVVYCSECGSEMKPSKAIANTLVGGMPDFEGDTHSSTFTIGGAGKVVDCLKCTLCGFSVSVGGKKDGKQ